MTRISSLLVASALAILPISAFAQQAATPAKTTAPTGVTTSVQDTAPVAGKTTTTTTAKVSKPDAKTTAMDTKNQAADAKTNAKTPATDTKTTEKSQVHGMSTVPAPHVKTVAPAKS